MQLNIPRLLISAPASGSGKTTLTCAIMAALKKRGLAVASFKCGPDYIDPMFHRRVVGTKSRNLDLFFTDPATTRGLLDAGSRDCDIAIIEGGMGFYDGIAVSDESSAWDIAHTTKTPVVLVVDARGRSLSIAAEVEGYARFRDESMIAGVIFNHAKPGVYHNLKDLIQQETGIPVFGYLPKMEDCGLESRHLGLVAPDEVDQLSRKVERLAEAVQECIDLDALIGLAGVAPVIEGPDLPFSDVEADDGPRIAVAQDSAFSFYYRENLLLLDKLGAEIVPFSPLSDTALPADIDGLYLGGGYPENHARRLSENTEMRAAVRRAVHAGMPTIAECGGFEYLNAELEGTDGAVYPMAGVFDGTVLRTDKLQRFGYITMEAREDSMIARAGERIPAHEYHYWDVKNPGDAFDVDKPQSTRRWQAGFVSDTLYAGFPHLYFYANPQMAKRFVDACNAYQLTRLAE